MRPIVTDRVTWSVCLSVGLSVTIVSPTKTAERIEMPFGLWAWVGPGNHVLDGGPDLPCESSILRGKWGMATHSKVGTLWSELRKNGCTNRDAVWDDKSCGKLGPRNRALDGVHIGATWRI